MKSKPRVQALMASAMVMLTVMSLPWTAIQAQQNTIEVTITSDNAYMFGFGDVNGIYSGALYQQVRNKLAADIYGSQVWDVNANGNTVPPYNQTPSYGAEKYTLDGSLSGRYIYVMAWSDNSQYQGTIAIFRDSQTNQTYKTGPGTGWEVYATGEDWDPSNANAPQLSDINQHIALANAKAGTNAASSVGWVDELGCSDGLAGCYGQLLYCSSFTSTIKTSYPAMGHIFGDAEFMWYRTPLHSSGSCNTAVFPGSESGEYLIFRLGPLDEIIPQPCDSIGARVEYDQDRPCCARILLSNASADFWEKIQIKLISGNAHIADVPHSNEWSSMLGTTPVMHALLFPNSGRIPVCSDQQFFSVCLGGSGQLQGLLELTWISRDSVLCRDTLDISCINPGDPCDDPKCATNSLDLNTGSGVSPGELEPHWQLTAVPPSAASQTVPRPPFVIDNHSAWYPYTGTSTAQWISANEHANWSTNNPNAPYVFEYAFCVCRDDRVTLDMQYWVDNSAVVKLDGIEISSTDLYSMSNFQAGTSFTHSFSVQAGVSRLLTIEVKNQSGVAMGLMVEGTITGSDPNNPTFITYECCNPRSSIIGRKILDIGCDGQETPTIANGIPGWEITLNGPGIVGTTTTDAMGYYYFNDLAPGSYTISEAVQQYFASTNPASGSYSVTLQENESMQLDFLNCLTDTTIYATIYGMKFEDTDGDGIQDPGESGIGGWVITGDNGLYNVTADDGTYRWSLLPPGTYTICEQMQDGWTATTPTCQTVTVQGGDNIRIDFGNKPEIPPCDDPKCSTNILDLNTGSGASPDDLEPHWLLTAVPPSAASTEAPRPPYVIDNHSAWYPYQGSSTAQWISANQHANWSTNNPSVPYEFEYCFCVCRDDTVTLDMKYWVDNSAVVKLDGVVISSTDLNSMSNFQSGTAFTHTFVVQEGVGRCLTIEVKNQSGVAMGLMVEGTITGSDPNNPTFITYECCNPRSSIIGRKIYDKDCDGLEKPTIANGIPGWEVTLDGPNGTMTTTTDSMGYYYFQNLLPGVYTITETMQPGFAATNPSSGSHTVTLGENESIQLDFLNCPDGPPLFGSICGIKFEDIDGNGVQDANEPVIEGWVITGTNGLYNVTDDSGWYCWSLLPPGTYTICEEMQDGWTATTPTCQTVTVGAGENVRIDFGNRQGPPPPKCDSLEVFGSLKYGDCCVFSVEIHNPAGYEIDAMSYVIHDAEMESVLAMPCANTVNMNSNTSGTITFSPTCQSDIMLELNATPTTSDGWVSVSLVIWMGNDTCTYSWQYQCDADVVTPCDCCDRVEYEPWPYDPLNQSAKSFTVFNEKLPFSPIDHIQVVLDPALPSPCSLDGGDLYVDGVELTTWGPVYDLVDDEGGSLSADLTVTFNIGIDVQCGWSGYVTLIIVHEDGDTCYYTMEKEWIAAAGEASKMLENSTPGGSVFPVQLRVQNTGRGPKHLYWVIYELVGDGYRFFAGPGADIHGIERPMDEEGVTIFRQSARQMLVRLKEPLAQGEMTKNLNLVIISDSATTPPEICAVGMDEAGNAVIHGCYTVDGVPIIGESGQLMLPNEIRLLNFFPNPVTGRGTINYALGSAMNVRLELHNELGVLVRTVEHGWKESGTHSISCDTHGLPSGNYFIKLSSGAETQTRQITVVK